MRCACCPCVYSNVLDELALLRQLLERVLRKEDTIMAMTQEERALLSKIDTNTSTVSDRIDVLVAKLTAAGQTDPADLAALQAISDHLEALGKDTSNPVPPVPAAATFRP